MKVTGFFSVIPLCTLALILSQDSFAQKDQSFTNGKSFRHEKRKDRPPPPVMGECPDSPFRSIDGTCNNVSTLMRITYGATDITLYREMLPHYGTEDHLNALSNDNRPSPRAVSNALCAQVSDAKSAFGLSSLVFTWGQFLDHDMTLTPEGHIEYAPITLPADEPLFSADIPFFRSEVYEGTGEDSYREQINLITAWIDASNVYGSDQARADWLRTFVDGKLKTSEGGLLPFNTISGEFNDAVDPDAPSMADDQGGTVITFVAGDVRASEQPGLTALHTLFVRHHNTICERLLNAGMTDDEQIYQTARREVGAIMQAITYNEFLPALGVKLNKYEGYKDKAQADISNLFATAGYRLGHTMVTDELLLRNDQCGEVGTGVVSLLEGFFNPQIVLQNGIDPILKGLAMQEQNEVDLMIIDNLRNFLFGDPSNGRAAGLDLASLNIQRGRDHGLPDYNTVRRHYTGERASSFDEISTDPVIAGQLESAYGDIDEIDAWVGLLAEDQLAGKSVGRTLEKILAKQFDRLRKGDRYFYLHDPALNQGDRDRIDTLKLADVIRANTSLPNIQENVFAAHACTAAAFIETEPSKGLQTDEMIVKISPNPSMSMVTIQLPNSESRYTLEIYDASGRLLGSHASVQGEYQLDISQLEAAIYTVFARSDHQRLHAQFVKSE